MTKKTEKTEKTKKAGIPARPKKQELLRAQSENFAALQEACGKYIRAISDAAFKQYLGQTHPSANLMEDVPFDVVAKAAAVASAARSAAVGEGLFELLCAAIQTAPIALRSERGRKSEQKRKTRAGGRKPDEREWVVKVRALSKFRDLTRDDVIERLGAAQLIELDDGNVRTLDTTGSVTEEFDIKVFKKNITNIMSNERARNFSSKNGAR